MKSKALEVNLSDTRAEVAVDRHHVLLLDFFQGYVGIVSRLETFLKELSHPYRNWGFIVGEARHFSLHYFHLYKSRSKGREALSLLCDILTQAFEAAPEADIRSNASDNLMLVLHHIAKEGGEETGLFLPLMTREINRVLALDDPDFFYFVSSYYQPDRLAAMLIDREVLNPEPSEQAESSQEIAEFITALNRLLIRYFDASFSFWLTQDDPLAWMRENIEEWRLGDDMVALLDRVSHDRVREWQTELAGLKEKDLTAVATTSALVELTGHRDFVKRFRDTPRKILSLSDGRTYGKYFKLTFLFYIIHAPGLSMIHREALGDIHRTLIRLIGERDYKKDIRIVDQTFALLKEHKGRYPGTVLECIHRIGDAVYNTDEIELINHFIDRSVDHGFQFPMIRGTGDDWQIKGNMAHVKNIRVFLNLVGKHPKKSKRLLSALITSLAVGGVFIRDTDLFPRDITTFLNTDIAPVYNLVKQLSRLLPTFFNEIGAEGELRDISTDLDESCFRRDRLIHFLRKQCHVESSSRIVEFIQEVINFWRTRDKSALAPYVPPSIFEEIESTGRFIDGPHAIFQALA
ncbi:MAG: pyruvate, phosphate dikinase, partial [Desulfobacterales bacterium]|nr:pyruvate, phosphate dikinase [Desulfobacterales bacterium]